MPQQYPLCKSAHSHDKYGTPTCIYEKAPSAIPTKTKYPALLFEEAFYVYETSQRYEQAQDTQRDVKKEAGHNASRLN